jgi:hypothetical protein
MRCPKGQIWDAQLKGCRNITMADLTNQPKQTSGVTFPNPRNNVPAGTNFLINHLELIFLITNQRHLLKNNKKLLIKLINIKKVV